MGAFWDAWDKYQANKNQAAMSEIQQAAGLAGLIQQANAVKAQEAAKGILASDVPDDVKIKGLMSLGAPGIQMAQQISVMQEHAAKTKKIQQQIGLDEVLARDPSIFTDPDKLSQFGARAVSIGHPGGATMLAQAQRLRDKKDADALVARLGGGATPQPSVPNVQLGPVSANTAMGIADPAERQAFINAAKADAAGKYGAFSTDAPNVNKVADLNGADAPTSQSKVTREQAMSMALSPNPQIRATGQKLLSQIGADEMQARREKAALELQTRREEERRRVEAAKGTKGNDTTGELSTDAIENKARMALYDPQWRVGYGRDTKTLKLVENRMAEIMKSEGITPDDVLSGRAGFKADSASLTKLTASYDAVTAFEKTAIRNGDRLLQLADKADTTGVPVIEKWIRAGRQATGDADVAQFNAQMQVYRTEAARILTNPNLTGQLTDTARKEVEHFLSGNSSPEQIKSVVNLLKNDFENRKATLEDQIKTIRQRMKGRVVGSESEAAAGGAMPPPKSSSQAQGGWSVVR